jgi:hypothetical protein
MAGNLFDVFVVGSADPSPAGETRLAAALSAKHGVPLATVAKAISAKNLRAGQSLEQGQAQALVRQLQSIGAVTVIRAAAGGGRPSMQSPAPGQVPRTPTVQPTPAPPLPSAPGRPKAATPSPGSGWPGALATPSPLLSHPGAPSGEGFGMPALTPPKASDPFSPLSSPVVAAPASAAGGRDLFEPRRVATPVIATVARPRQGGTATPPSPALPDVNHFSDDITPGPKLDLARDRNDSDSEIPELRTRPAASATSLREVAMTRSSGVAVDEDPKNLNLVRCVQHGLYYDKSKASGCRKCLSPAREIASKMQADATAFHVGDFRRRPGKRAFLGLAFALVIGLLPATYFCFGPGATEARKLRVEQELLSRQPGTDEILRRFEELDGQVRDSHDRATRNTAIVWFAVASVAMVGWYKIT